MYDAARVRAILDQVENRLDELGGFVLEVLENADNIVEQLRAQLPEGEAQPAPKPEAPVGRAARTVWLEANVTGLRDNPALAGLNDDFFDEVFEYWWKQVND